MTAHHRPERHWVVRHAPAARLIASLPPRSVDLLLTDPPYDTADRHGQYLTRWFAGRLTWPQIGRLLAVAKPRLKPDGLVMVMANEAGLGEAQRAVAHAGYHRQRVVVWNREAPGLGSGLRHQVEYVVVGLLPTSRTLSGRDLVSVPAVGPRTRGRYPTEKPAGLGRELAAIAGLRRGDTVVDPFCGSGALLVGPLERGARVVAGDTSPRAVRLATQRLRTAAAAQSRRARKPQATSLESRSRKAATAIRNSARATPRRRSRR